MQMGALLPESPLSKNENFTKFLASKSRSLGSQHFIEQLAAKEGERNHAHCFTPSSRDW
jgi:hypothetical protein